MIEFKISPESIEKFRASVKAFEALRLGEYSIPIVINRDMPPAALTIGAMSSVFREYYETSRRNELALFNAVYATGIPAHEIRAMAACSPLPFDIFCQELVYDKNHPKDSEAPHA